MESHPQYYVTAYTGCDIQLQNVTPDESETCRALNDK